MYLSQILENKEYKIVNEKEFSALGLVSSEEENLLTYISEEKYISCIKANVNMVITTEDLCSQLIDKGYGVVVAKQPKELFWTTHQLLENRKEYVRDSFSTIISEKASVSKNVSIANKNVVIEDDVVIEDFVTIYENTHIKKGSVIRSGSIIGGVGFQICKIGKGLKIINHYGGVVIGENVEILNNTCVARGVFPENDTIINDFSKIDNFVHISHECQIGKNCMIAAGVALGGSCHIGDDVWIGLGAVVRNNVAVGDGCRINMGSVVVENIDDGMSVSGNYAISHERFLLNQIKMRR